MIPGGGNGGDGDPDPKLDDDDQTLRMIHQAALEVLEDADPEGLPVGGDGLPPGTPPWDDPEGANGATGAGYRIIGTVMEADTFPTGRKPHGYRRGWWAGAAAWCALPLIAAATLAVTVVRWGW